MVLKNIPTLMGRAMRHVRLRIGSVVREGAGVIKVKTKSRRLRRHAGEMAWQMKEGGPFGTSLFVE
jgi:hypothetical protein